MELYREAWEETMRQHTLKEPTARVTGPDEMSPDLQAVLVIRLRRLMNDIAPQDFSGVELLELLAVIERAAARLAEGRRVPAPVIALAKRRGTASRSPASE
jgi:hypothetical protein